MGTPFAYDMGDAILSPEAIADPPPFSKARSVVLYDDAARRIVHRLKYKDRTELARLMSRWMVRAGTDVLEPADAVIAVPLHWRRLMARRYNQSAELARSVAGLAGLPHLPGVLVRKKPTRQQVGLGRQARLDNLRGAFTVAEAGRSRLIGRNVVVVDDVYTTGATVRTAAKALLKAGASDVTVLTFARVAAE
jgi:ComF family protein